MFEICDFGLYNLNPLWVVGGRGLRRRRTRWRGEREGTRPRTNDHNLRAIGAPREGANPAAVCGRGKPLGGRAATQCGSRQTNPPVGRHHSAPEGGVMARRSLPPQEPEKGNGAKRREARTARKPYPYTRKR